MVYPNFIKRVIPLRIESTLNKREHWAQRHARSKVHRNAAIVVPKGIPKPCLVKLVRIAPRKLDDDNLAGGFKSLRDGIADRLEVDDGSHLVQWVYEQEKRGKKEYAARIEIYFMAENWSES